jgi:sugar lactone lactonase YvrE
MANLARRRTRKILALVGGGAALAAALAVTGISAASTRGGSGTQSGASAAPSASAPALLTDIALPNGFQPEGIAIGAEPVAFFGSLADGAIFRADLVTGEGKVIGEAPGTPSVGMKVDAQGRLFVAGGRAGDARVIDVDSGEILQEYDLATEAASFVNDVVLTPAGAFFTDSTNPVLYHLPIGADGTLPAEAEQLPLTGDIVYGEGINANGIALAPDGETLLIVQTNTGLLFSVDPATGVTAQTAIEAASGDALLANGDGLLVDGTTLFAVQNRLNTLAVLTISEDGSQAEITDRLTDARFDVPTTVAASGSTLFLPNARFGIEATPDTEYSAVAIPKP